MQVNLPEWLGVIGAVLSIALALGAALALVKGSYNKARIAALREDNDDLRARVGDLDAELERRKLKEETTDAKIAKVDSENQLLRNMVTQRAEVDQMKAELQVHHDASMRELSDHHDAAMGAWTQVSQTMTQVGDALTILIERNKT